MSTGDGEKNYNHLRGEKSPYLIQHVWNPVDWYPWGERAFEKAKKDDKPIFLSIGYSTCHWCHVMAHESFEDQDVARLMNDAFVSVKVDREERPDIDGVYMAVCQLMTGSGGWPLTIIMTPDKKPFFAATYIPRNSRFGGVGMVDLIPRVRDLWARDRGRVMESVAGIEAALTGLDSGGVGADMDEAMLSSAFRQLSNGFDRSHGGFGTRPKFPTPHNIMFLLRYWRRTGAKEALMMVERTLQEMRKGGIYDHLGFGFHRYSTDREWLVPHFEKMLYDQALLAMAYMEAFQATGRDEYAHVPHEIFSYVLRDMTSPEGAFYSAEDADSEGVEGKFYVWTEEELRGVLTGDDADLAVEVFNVSPEGNFKEEATGRMTGANILHMTRGSGEIAERLGMPEEELVERLGSIREVLLEIRLGRVRPHLDDKVLADWNGLMIAALARGAQVFADESYAEAAKRAAGFIMDNMRTPEGRLLHRYRDSEAAVDGTLDDYAFMIWGFLELYWATFRAEYIRAALGFLKEAVARFWDQGKAGFFFTPQDGEELLVRKKEIYDGAAPSGNSVMFMNLMRLGRVTSDTALEEMASQMGRAFSSQVIDTPTAHTMLLSGLDFAIGPSYEVVIAGEPEKDDTLEMLRALRQGFYPNITVLFVPVGEGSPEIGEFIEDVDTYELIKGKAAAYVCTNFNCQVPTNQVDVMLERLGKKTV